MTTTTKALLAVLILSIAASAETLTMLTEASSKMPTGTVFRAQDSAGRIYSGYLATRRARRLWRSGSMLLVFSDHVRVVASDPEGSIHGRVSKKKLAITAVAALALAKLSDDVVEGAIGPGKARYVGLGSAAITTLLQKGGESVLRVGDTVEVEHVQH